MIIKMCGVSNDEMSNRMSQVEIASMSGRAKKSYLKKRQKKILNLDELNMIESLLGQKKCKATLALQPMI